MALAPSLLPGFQYRVKTNGGDLAGEVVTIIDNNTFPDSDSRRRRITVEHDGSTVYLLPRVLEDTPVSMVPVTALPHPVTPGHAPNATVEQEVITHGGTLYLDELLPVNAPVLAAVSTAIGALAPITDPMDPRLDHLRPKRSKVRKYRNRFMANGMTDIEFLLTYASDAYRAQNEGRPVNLTLKGDTQSGKTMLVEVLAVAWSDYMADEQRRKGEVVTFTKPMPIFTLSGSAGVTDYDLFGQTTSWTDPATGISHLIWLPGIVELAAQCGGILYLDEMNAMKGNVTSSLHPVIDHRHQFINRQKPVFKDGQFMPEVVTASLDLWVIATLNEGYRDMGLLNEAFSQRFEHILWGYSEEVEKQLVKSPPLRLFAEALRTARAGKALQTPIGTKALERFQLNIATFGVEMAFQTLLGMFQPQERKKVETIFVDRTFQKMLEDELAQAKLNEAAEAAAEAAAQV